MANGKIRFGKQSGGQLALVIPDGVTNTEVIVPESGILATRGELLIGDSGSYAQHGLVPNDGVNEIRPRDMFAEVDVPDVLVDKKCYPVRFTDGVYDRSKFIESYPAVSDKLKANSITIGDYTLYSIGDYIKVESISNNFTALVTEVNPAGYISIAHTYDRIGGELHTMYKLPQFALPKAPFATGSTDELLDDKVNGLTTQVNHSKGAIIVTGNELVTNGTLDSDSDWTKGTGWTISGGSLIGTSVNGHTAFQSGVKMKAGHTYIFEFTLSTYSSGALEYHIPSATQWVPIVEEIGKTYTILITPTANNSSINFRGVSGAPFTGSIDNISVKLKEQSYIALQDTTAGDLLSDTSKFKPIPYVTKQVALLIEKTSAGAILNTVKPLVNMYGEESVETYEADIMSELNYSQLKDRVFTDGLSEYILLGLKTYLNSGAYHSWINPLGSRKFSDDKLWYETTDTVGGLYDCF